MKILIRLVFFMGILALMAGCDSRDDEPVAANTTYDMAIAFLPDPPQMGMNDIEITLVDGDGDSINDATITITATYIADPAVVVQAQSDDSQGDGIYILPIDFSADGQWQLVLTADTANGITTESVTIEVGATDE